MSAWSIRLPYRDRGQPLDLDLVDLAPTLDDPEEEVVARDLLWNAMTDPELETVGDLLDRVESMRLD